MQLNRWREAKTSQTGYLPPMPGSSADLVTSGFIRRVPSRESSREANADIPAALSVLACAPYRARLAVLGRIAEAGRRCWTYSLARIAEWRRCARSRSELMVLGEHDLLDIGMTRSDARMLASKPFWRR